MTTSLDRSWTYECCGFYCVTTATLRTLHDRLGLLMTTSATSPVTLFTGNYLVRGEEGYEASRVARVFSTRHPERYPAAILVAHTEQDIVQGVRLAREKGWQVGVRAGGHSFPVWG